MHLLQSVQQRLDKDQLLRSGDVSLKFMNAAGFALLNNKEFKSESLPAVTNPSEPVTGFNFAEYSKYLQTEVLGQVVLYSDVVTSTMSLFDR